MTVWSRIGDAVSRLVSGETAGRLVERIAGLAGSGSSRNRDITFSLALIALSAKMARADGVVTFDERRAFGDIFAVEESDQKHVDRVFELAERDVAGFEAYARQVHKIYENDPETLKDVLDGLFHIAKADGVVHERELAYLETVAGIFGFDDVEYRRIRARHVRMSEDPYLILGVSADADMDEIKRAYRALVRDNHPDQLIARGVPEECQRIASERMAAINEAYEVIERERGQ